VSYKTVLAIEDGFARQIRDQTNADENIVCPRNLRQHIFTVSALDNLDHNPTSRTATSSFHGTGISIFQFPSPCNPGICREPLIIDSRTQHLSDKCNTTTLPHSYTFVPSVGRNLATQPIHREVVPKNTNSVDLERKHEEDWMEEVCKNILNNSENEFDTAVTWSSYHAARSDCVGEFQTKCVEALLPLFYKKAASQEMIMHGMQIIASTTEFLNPSRYRLWLMTSHCKRWERKYSGRSQKF